MISAGIPTVFVNAEEIGYTGTELREAINTDPKRLALRADPRRRCAAHGPDQDAGRGRRRASTRRRSPSWRRRRITPRPAANRSRCRRHRPAGACALDGQAAPRHDGHLRGRHRHCGGHSRHPGQPGRRRRRARGAVRFGHPSGTLRVGAEAAVGGRTAASGWVKKAIMSRSARMLDGRLGGVTGARNAAVAVLFQERRRSGLPQQNVDRQVLVRL
jgi:hypothetical protein